MTMHNPVMATTRSLWKLDPRAGRADVDNRTIRDPLRGEKGPFLLCKFA